MHAAPPVRMEIAAESRWHAFITVCVGAALANLGTWIASLWQPPAAVLAAVALLSASTGAWLAWTALRRNTADRGALTWDGAVWQWAPEEKPSLDLQASAGAPRVVVDLGIWMLLRFEAAPPACAVLWLPVSRRQAGASWPHWRAALFSSRLARDPAPDPS